LHCTVTIGDADFAEGSTADEAINLADKRLYEGKQAGRNRVVLGSAVCDIANEAETNRP